MLLYSYNFNLYEMTSRFEIVNELNAISMLKEERSHGTIDVHYSNDPVNQKFFNEWNNHGSLPAFTIYVHRTGITDGSVGCLFVPQGSEWKYEFSSQEGLVDFSNDYSFDTFLIVILSRVYSFSSYKYDDLKKVIEQLMQKLGVPHKNLTFITGGQKGEALGMRKLLGVYKSSEGGRIFVEDVVDFSYFQPRIAESKRKKQTLLLCDPLTNFTRIFRRMLFESDQAAIQSEHFVCYPSNEIALNSFRSSSSDLVQKVIIDPSSLSFEYHQVIVASIVFFEPLMSILSEIALQLTLPHRFPLFQFLVLGLGAGGLSSFLSSCLDYQNIDHITDVSQKVNEAALPIFSLQAVELDGAVVELARKWFGFSNGCHIGDAILFVNDLYEKVSSWQIEPCFTDPRVDILIIDIDNKDLEDKYLSFPPRPFVSFEFLKRCKVCLRESGMLLINAGIHQLCAKFNILKRLRVLFETVCEVPIEDNQNNILIATGPRQSMVESFADTENDLEFSIVNSCSIKNDVLVNEIITKKIPLLATALPIRIRSELVEKMTVQISQLRFFVDI